MRNIQKNSLVNGSVSKWVVVLVLTITMAFYSVLVPRGAKANETKKIKSLLECPVLNEKDQDCPWAGMTRMIEQRLKEQKTKNSNTIVAKVIQEYAPHLLRQIKADAQDQFTKERWGKSINFDEGVKAKIVDESILDSLLKIYRTEPRQDKIVHAGLEHVYGYLFSNLVTPFGFKRARWVASDIRNGFGFSEGVLDPSVHQGTLLKNLTYFILKATGESTLGLNKKVHQELVNFSYESLKRIRLSEKLKLAVTAQTASPEVIIHTDFIAFKNQPTDATLNSHLLIYSYQDSREKNVKIVTAFPVTQKFVEMVTQAANLGEAKPIQSRYNAFIEGVSGVTGLLGVRDVKSF